MTRPTPRNLVFAALLTLTTFAVPAQAENLSAWRKDTGSSTQNLDTASPSLGDGTGTSALNNLISAGITPATLSNTGDTFTFSGTVAFSGLSGTDAQLGHGFRWGAYNVNGSTNNNGWLGYYAENASGTTVGNLFERNDPNTGSWWSATGATSLKAIRADSDASLVDGTYTFNLTLERSAASELTVSWSLTGTGGAAAYSLTGSFIDTTPETFTFDRVGLGSAGLSASQISFSNVSANTPSAIPEPASVAFLTGWFALAWLNLRRPRHV